MMKDYPESIKDGKKAENLFMFLFSKNKKVECTPSTEYQNKIEHIDCFCGGWSFDVKGQRKKKGKLMTFAMTRYFWKLKELQVLTAGFTAKPNTSLGKYLNTF